MANRTKPWNLTQHNAMGADLATLGTELMDMQESIGKAYPYSTEPAREVRNLIRGFNKLRGALVSRFFGEGHSTDGSNPYYPKGMKPVKVAEPTELSEKDEGEDDSE